MGNRSRIVNLFKEASNGSDGKLRIYVVGFALVAIIAMGFALVNERNKALADAAITNSIALENVIYQERIAQLHQRLHEVKKAALFGRNIEVRNLKATKRPEGGYFVKGEIKNRCKQALGDIGLTIYGLDDEKLPVYEKAVMTRSSDGKPLLSYHKREFTAVLEDVPRAKDFAAVVNSVDLVDVVIQERMMGF